MVARQHAAFNTDDYLAYYCGSIIGAWIGDHLIRLVIESWKGQFVRVVNGMPLLPFNWSDKLKIAAHWPSNWYAVLAIGIGVGGLLWFIQMPKGLRRPRWVLFVSAFVASWCLYGAFHRLFPPPLSRSQVAFFGYSGYFAEALNSMMGWALIWLLVYGSATLFLLMARRIRE